MIIWTLRLRAGQKRHCQRALVDDWTACHTLVDLRWKAGWLDGPGHPHDRTEARLYTRYLRPLSLPPRYWQGPGELRLAKAAASNAAPGMYPWADAVQRWERLDRRQRNYTSIQVTRAHDSMGNVIAEERSPETPAAFVPLGG